MILPDYVSIEEVANICGKLEIRNWTKLTKAEVTAQEAEVILAELEIGDMKISVENFRGGLEVELEHGIRFPEANITNNHPILTGKIVLAHFKESLDYYLRLEVAEIEGDLLKAVVNKNASKVAALYEKLLKAKHQLSQAETKMY
ncbi:hypothetical protein E4G67_01660 [Candidatus Bathyarchaeota archaeon]|nr:MAG: hypothetical protein E4G67_01660 [Candidatus Bathyarchaeota archaeon]